MIGDVAILIAGEITPAHAERCARPWGIGDDPAGGHSAGGGIGPDRAGTGSRRASGRSVGTRAGVCPATQYHTEFPEPVPQEKGET